MLILTIIFLLIIFFAGIILHYSPGEIKPFINEKGNQIPESISEKIFVQIGGVKQGMIIRGKNANNPILLFVHGGPAFPTYFLTEKYPSDIEEYFTVCYWEQRGGGLSFHPELPIEGMTLDQLASDAIEVTNYLRNRFSKDKIYLMAHSGGTSFAIQAVASAPNLYHAYIGIAQITNQLKSEILAYNYLLEQSISINNKSSVSKLKDYPINNSDQYAIPFFKSMVRDELMHEFGVGTMREMKSVFKDVFLTSWFCKAYTIQEKLNIWRSKFSFIKKTSLVEQIFARDITKQFPKLEIPTYFFSGKFDLTVNTSLSKAYLIKLNAPIKGFYTFSESAHSPNFEEPVKFVKILREDVLNNKINLADIDL